MQVADYLPHFIRPNPPPRLGPIESISYLKKKYLVTN